MFVRHAVLERLCSVPVAVSSAVAGRGWWASRVWQSAPRSIIAGVVAIVRGCSCAWWPACSYRFGRPAARRGKRRMRCWPAALWRRP